MSQFYALLACACAATAHAQPPAPLDCASISLGAFYTDPRPDYYRHNKNYRLQLSGTGAVYAESRSAFPPLLELNWRHAFSRQLRMYADA